MQTCNNTPDEKKDFRELQYAFTNHLRDPDNTQAPGDIEERRVQIYRDLLYNNVESFIAGSFPVLRKLLDDDAWHKMLRDYFKNHISHTPLFPKMPQEFLHYLQNERESTKIDYPFMFELAHYEWVELAIELDNRSVEMQAVDAEAIFSRVYLVLNPVCMPLAYEWPVHLISPEFIPNEKPQQQTYIIVYRMLDFKTSFVELNPVSAKLIENIQKNESKNGRELLIDIAKEINHPDENLIITTGLQIMQDMQQRQVLLGTIK